MGIRTVIVLSILAMAFAVVVLFVWIGQRRQQQRLRAIARYNRERQQQSRHDMKGPKVVEMGAKRVIIDPLVDGFVDEATDDLDEDISLTDDLQVSASTASENSSPSFTTVNSAVNPSQFNRTTPHLTARPAQPSAYRPMTPQRTGAYPKISQGPLSNQALGQSTSARVSQFTITSPQQNQPQYTAQQGSETESRGPVGVYHTQPLQSELSQSDSHEQESSLEDVLLSSSSQQSNPNLRHSTSRVVSPQVGNAAYHSLRQPSIQARQPNRYMSPSEGQQVPPVERRPSEASASQASAYGANSATAEPVSSSTAQQYASSPSAQQPTSTLPAYLTFSLMAEKGKSFGGYDLLQTILGTGLRHGERQIFHRYDAHRPTKILFSLASIAKPGTFSLDGMGAFSTPGLIFIFELERTPTLLNTFELLLETARQLNEELDGNLLDDRREPLTTERIQALREQLREITPVNDFAEED